MSHSAAFSATLFNVFGRLTVAVPAVSGFATESMNVDLSKNFKQCAQRDEDIMS